jgi:hypothetical protein
VDVRTHLIENLDKSRSLMLAVLAELDQQLEIYPHWTVKEFLAHLTGWDDATTTSLRAHALGNEPGTPAVEGIDVYNAQSVSTRETLDYDHIYKEWLAAREQLKSVILALPDEKFEQPLLFPWGRIGSVAQLVEIMYDHEEEHAEEVRERYRKPSAA